MFANFKHVLKSHVGVLIHHKMFQCSQWNARWGLGLEPWGLKISNFLNIFWIFECLFGFVLCIVQYAHVSLCALCTMPLYKSMIHCLKLEYSLAVVRGLELQIWSGLWCKHIDIASRQISFETWVQIFWQCLSLAMCIWYMFV